MSHIINLAVIGAGNLGSKHCEKILHSANFHLAAIVDKDISRAQSLSNINKCKTFSSHKELLQHAKDLALQAVIIVTDSKTHFEIAKDCIMSGLHTFIEKPVTTCPKHAEELIQLRDTQNVIVHVGHIERFNPAIVEMNRILEQNKKKSIFFQCQRLSKYGHPSGNTDDIVLDLMIHDLDIVLNWVKSEVKKTTASGTSILSESTDCAYAQLQFENGCIANFMSSRVNSRPIRLIKLVQKEYFYEINSLDKSLYSFHKKDKSSHNPNNFVANENFFPLIDAMETEQQEFYKAIQAQKNLGVSLEEASKAVQVASDIIKEINKKSS